MDGWVIHPSKMRGGEPTQLTPTAGERNIYSARVGDRCHGGVAATGHTPTPSCFHATFRVGGGGLGG